MIEGSKGSEVSQPRPSVEAPDSLHSTARAKVLDLLSEGEIKGLVNGARSVFLDDTPLQNEDGSYNFANVKMDFRSGTQDQAHIPGFPSVDNELGIGVELRADTPWVRAVTNLQLSALRVRLSVPRLAAVNTSNGDTGGHTVAYAIDVATDGGAYEQVLQSAFSGKTSSKYERSHRVDLPQGARQGWSVRVRRLTANASSNSVADTTNIESVTEVIDAKLRYPGSAICGVQYGAEQFSSNPSRSYDCYGRILRVPSNYDPEKRSYSGIWDGTFKPAWSDNPAWIYYDLLLHYRYGLGHLITAAQIDKWELYRISQYCDQMVSDGKGGVEPRFTCNLYLQAQGDALKVLQDLAGIFRGMVYWFGGQMSAVADMPEDPIYTYTAANVIEGRFSYAGTSGKTRHTVALVSWNNPVNNYKAEVEAVTDETGVARYGVQQVEITATGCTSQGQAQRLGRWALMTNRLETETVTFSTGLEGIRSRPGQIIRVSDPHRAGRRIGGRIRTADRNAVVIDESVEVRPGDRLTIILPTGRAESRRVKLAGNQLTVDSTQYSFDMTTITMDKTGYAQGVQVVEVEEPFSLAPVPQSIWAVESATLAPQLFRVLSVAERIGENEVAFEVMAIEHVPAKFEGVDSSTIIETPPITVIPPSVQPAPGGVLIEAETGAIDQGIVVTSMVISWPPARSAVAYEVQWRRDGGEWVNAGRVGACRFEVTGIYAGRYLAKVRAINALGVGSIWSTSVETVLSGKTSLPPSVSFLAADAMVMGIKVRWGIPAGVSTADLQRTEIWYSQTSDQSQAVKLGDFAYPQSDYSMLGLASGQRFWFWARLVDRSGNIGAWSAMAAGQASSDAGPILNYLSGQITDSQLGQQLLAKVNSGGGANVLIEEIKSGLAAMFSIKTQLTVDGKPYLAGIGVGVENNSGIMTSQVLVAADRFAVVHPNGLEVSSPFVVQDGQVYINQAVIGKGWITNAMIGDSIQSDNYVKGEKGWRIDKASNEFEMNGSLAGGGRLSITNQLIQIFYGNGKLCLRAGIWS